MALFEIQAFVVVQIDADNEEAAVELAVSQLNEVALDVQVESVS